MRLVYHTQRLRGHILGVAVHLDAQLCRHCPRPLVHHRRDDQFFGYALAEGLYVAEPEKALLDQCYLAARGLTSLTWGELDLSMSLIGAFSQTQTDAAT